MNGNVWKWMFRVWSTGPQKRRKYVFCTRLRCFYKQNYVLKSGSSLKSDWLPRNWIFYKPQLPEIRRSEGICCITKKSCIYVAYPTKKCHFWVTRHRRKVEKNFLGRGGGGWFWIVIQNISNQNLCYNAYKPARILIKTLSLNLF